MQDKSGPDIDPIGYVFKIADNQRDFDLIEDLRDGFFGAVTSYEFARHTLNDCTSWFLS
jgi:hypothetical protein